MEEQEGDKLSSFAERKAARRPPHCETRMKILEHYLDMLTELVSTLVTALGQNVANMALPSLQESFLLMQRARRLNLPKRVGMPEPARHK